MNIYRVTNIDTQEEFTGTTEEVMDKLFITKDTLFWHVKTRSQYAGYVFEKIGTDKRANKPRKEEPRQTQINQGLNDDLAKARENNMSYGEWKLLQRLRG